MRLPIVILAVLGLACGKSLPTRNLNDDLNDFLALVPLEKVLNIALDYLANDAEVQELILYLQSEDFHKIVRTVEELEEFKQLIKIPEELGVDVNSIINLIHEIIGLPPYAVRKNTRRGVGINGLIDDVIAVLPIDELKALFEEKLKTSADFKAFIDAIQSPEFKRILDTLESLPEFQELLQNLRDKGVDVDRFIELLKALFGLSRRGTRSLRDDLNDFLAVIPVDEIVAIAKEYLEHDEEVKELVSYLQSDKWNEEIGEIIQSEELNAIIQYLRDRGVEVISQVNELLGLPPFPVRYESARRGNGINGLVDDVINVLPVEKLKELFQHKLINSPEFLNLVKTITSPEFQELARKLIESEHVQHLLEDLKEKKVDLQHIIRRLKEAFGLSRRGTRSLKDDVNDFLAVIPVDEIARIAWDYVLNDKEVQELVIHVQSREFQELVEKVLNLKELKDLISFLEDNGVEIVSQIKKRLGLPTFSVRGKGTRRGEGVNGLVDDIIKVLPVEKLKELFKDKLINSPNFRRLVDAIRSPEFKELERKLKATPEVKELEDDLRNHGVDKDRILERLKEAFGLSQRGIRNLNDDLNDFLALVPLDKIIAILLDYLANDAQVQELVLYLQSEEFHKIVRTVEELEEFKQLIKIPEELGVDVNSIINLIHEVIGLPPYAVRKNTRRGVGINGLIDDVIAVLPIDELKALFEEKLKTSEDFKVFIEAIRSPEFQRILDTLESLPEVQELLQDLRDKGVDVDHFIELLKKLFGLSRH